MKTKWRVSRVVLQVAGWTWGCGSWAWAQEPPVEAPDSVSPSSEEAETEQSEPEQGEPPASSEEGGASRAPQIELPRLIQGVAPEYPAQAQGEGQVILVLTIDSQGQVVSSEVHESAGALFDAAAQDAARSYRFEPARRAGLPVSARVRMPFLFLPELPPAPSATGPKSADPEKELELPGAPVEPEKARPDPHLEVNVHGERPLRTTRRGASDFMVHREVITAAPRQEGADVLRLVPGLTSFRTEGLAVAHSYSLRGFDSAHGQDLEFLVGGLPINLPNHIHGQGYADLSFLIGEVVDELHVSEGVSDPKQGDFAVAGTIDIGLGVDQEHRGLQLKSGYGSFQTFRQHASWAPREGHRESFGAIQYTKTAGFGENRAGQSASGIVQHRFGSGALTYRFIGIAHTARADHAGVLRREDIESGENCYHCVYQLPTARAQNGLAQRLMAGFFADYRGRSHENGSLGVWISHDHFRSQQNFTGFSETSRTLALVSGRGDLIEQRNTTHSIGITGRYRTEAFKPMEGVHGTLELGTNARFDVVHQQQNLLDGAVRNQTWDRRVDASISGMDVGVFGDLDWEMGSMVRARVGVRADALSYEAEDRLGNFAPTVRPQDAFIPGYRRSAMGLAVGPRASVEVRPLPWLSVLSSYGEGYRSPQARTLADGEKTPFTKVHSGDVGVRMRWGEPLELSSAAFYTRLSDDIAFDASEGRMERIGATQRMGLTLHALSHLTDWSVTSFSLTYVRATLLEPPPASAEEPAPPFVAGQRIPYVSPLVIRLDQGAHTTLVSDWGGKPLVGRAGLGFTFLAGRPLPFGQVGDNIGLLDASLGLSWGVFELALEGFNLLNRNYPASEYQFVSHWDPKGVPSRVPSRHITAGAPLSFFLSLGVTL